MFREATDEDLAELEGLESDAATIGVGTTSADSRFTSAPPSPIIYTRDSIYDGDLKDDSGPLKDNKWQTLPIPSPAFLVALYIKSFREGQQVLYEWQKEQLAEIGDSNSWATVHKPYKLALCAANGSGKDYLIVAPTVVWMSLVNIRCLTIITSSSGSQLTAQTENYIKALCQTINEYHQQEFFRIRQRYIKCNLTGSEIRLFATDEAGKAEGYHPLEPDAKMVIIVNEAKSVSEEIFGALRRCTGYTHWLNVSTPGAPSGSFHRACTKEKLGFRFRRITYKECRSGSLSHMSDAERIADEEELGKNSALYRSKWLALFTTLNTDSVITTETLEQLIDNKVDIAFQDWPLRIGGDIAAGGDESALVATRGNRIVKEEGMREKDTTITADWFERLFNELGISKNHEYIFMDDGGIGHAVIDMLRAKGWNVRRIRNEHRAVRPKDYGNRGAELWYQAGRIAEERLFRLDEASQKLRDQLVSRHYKKSGTGGRVFLESKKEAIADGRPSPDRADALILSLCGLTVSDFLQPVQGPQQLSKPKMHKLNTPEELAAYVEELAYAEFDKPISNGRRIHNSLAAATQLTTDSNHEDKYGYN